MLPAIGTFVSRTIRAVRLLARDGRIPRPLRGAAALGLLPVPGPFDEALLLVVALLLWIFYRESLLASWRRARDPLPADSRRRPERPVRDSRSTTSS
jgi:hypothetical protein